jgi:hypothetical protein
MHLPTVRTKPNEDAVITVVKLQPWRISREFGLSQPRVFRVLHDDQWHPYHFSRSAYLFPDDYPLWTQFCKWLWHQRTTDRTFLCNILWTDEACLICEGLFNAHSLHLWTRDRPDAIFEHPLQRRCLGWNIRGHVIRPYLLPDRLSAQLYSGNHSARVA